MTWNGSGTFSRKTTSVSPATGNTTIDSADMNTYTADVTAGINATRAKNGENSPTANLPMGGFKHTGAADGVADTDYATMSQLNAQTQGIFSNNANGSPSVSSTVADISSATTATTVGPTAASQTITWTALDALPLTIDWIEVRCFVHVELAATIGITGFIRAVDGDSTINGAISDTIAYSTFTDGTSDTKKTGAYGTAKIPVNATNSIKVIVSGSAGITILTADMALTGYGWN